MNLSVLVASMDQEDHSLIKKMNIKTDAIVVNQCNKSKIESFNYGKNNIRYISLNERGVGLSRNTALMRANSDIVVFADEDERFVENYEKKIVDQFQKNPNADMILFNVKSLNPERKIKQVTKKHRVHWYNLGKYGAVRIALKTQVVFEKNIFFSLLFGGGAKYANGEDSLFIMDCLKSGMKIYATNVSIGTVEQRESVWFDGYNSKFFADRGTLYKKMFGKKYIFASLFFLIKKYSLYKNDITFLKALKHMITNK